MIHKALIDATKVLLPPMHIKLGLIKNFVKALKQDGAGIRYIKSKFQRISDAKIKEGIFVGPQIRELMIDSKFDAYLIDHVYKMTKNLYELIAT